jgi:polar amino acid transport system ATP-binding protein
MPEAVNPRKQLVVLQGLTKRFGTAEILRSVDLQVDQGEVVVIIGPSGSGKDHASALVSIFWRTTRAGESWWMVNWSVTGTDNGRPAKLPDRVIARMRADVGMVFQSFNLFPHMTALDNVMLGLREVRRMSALEARQNASAWLERVGLKDKLGAFPAQLSGGQQQRVAIARAVAMKPKSCCSTRPHPPSIRNWSAKC